MTFTSTRRLQYREHHVRAATAWMVLAAAVGAAGYLLLPVVIAAAWIAVSEPAATAVWTLWAGIVVLMGIAGTLSALAAESSPRAYREREDRPSERVLRAERAEGRAARVRRAAA